MLDLFVVDGDHPDAKGLIGKLGKEHADGEVIPLTKGEMDLYNSDRFKVIISGGDEKALKLVEVPTEGGLIFVIQEGRVNIDDLLTTIERHRLKATIIRTKQ